ncbi:hypothetical protein L1887_47414 [Cichorium endivia]|nr:hypothetical protein L1887_47414 [Cichorium endivia]
MRRILVNVGEQGGWLDGLVESGLDTLRALLLLVVVVETGGRRDGRVAHDRIPHNHFVCTRNCLDELLVFAHKLRVALLRFDAILFQGVAEMGKHGESTLGQVYTSSLYALRLGAGAELIRVRIVVELFVGVGKEELSPIRLRLLLVAPEGRRSSWFFKVDRGGGMRRDVRCEEVAHVSGAPKGLQIRLSWRADSTPAYPRRSRTNLIVK